MIVIVEVVFSTFFIYEVFGIHQTQRRAECGWQFNNNFMTTKSCRGENKAQEGGGGRRSSLRSPVEPLSPCKLCSLWLRCHCCIVQTLQDPALGVLWRPKEFCRWLMEESVGQHAALSCVTPRAGTSRSDWVEISPNICLVNSIDRVCCAMA